MCGAEWGPASNRRRCTLEKNHPPVRNMFGHWCPNEKSAVCANCDSVTMCGCSVWDTLYKGCPPAALEDAKRQHAGKLAAEARCEKAERKLYDERKARRTLLRQIRALVKEDKER